jgi:hypothetical protein
VHDPPGNASASKLTFSPRGEFVELFEQTLRLDEPGAAGSVVHAVLAAQQLAQELLLLVRQAVARHIAQEAGSAQASSVSSVGSCELRRPMLRY